MAILMVLKLADLMAHSTVAMKAMLTAPQTAVLKGWQKVEALVRSKAPLKAALCSVRSVLKTAGLTAFQRVD